MKLPSVKDLKVQGKRVLLRTNYDVPLKKTGVADDSRIVESLETINWLLRQKAKVIIATHLGRPEGKVTPGLSLVPVVRHLSKLLSRRIPLIEDIELISEEDGKKELIVLENLRFYPGEETNSKGFSRQLASLADFYVNDAFAVSHRQHASVVGAPLILKSAFGLDFLEEVESLTKVLKKPRRPLVVILGGVKKSKITAVKKMVNWADFILLGGQMITYEEVHQIIDHHQKVVGSLTRNGEDITQETVAKFKKIIAQAKTIVFTGPMGAYEEKKYEGGTRQICQAIVDSGAYTVVGGGDTEAALTKFGLVDKINFISSGGGAMLAFLAEKNLPGIKAIVGGKR